MAIEKPNCGAKHLALVAGFVAILIGLFVTLTSMQSATADKLEQRIRINEQFRAEVGVKLDVIANDIKEIKQAVKPVPVTRSNP
ncbi:MAG TPA: hypothetical protein VMW24_16290 [Sedimentisphaerales bacterium]|nr:hypothetical protein [Sedimentisphaerales bacterium]